MLMAGELEAIYSPPRPQRYDPVNGPIVRLFPDIRAIEQDYFRRTGCFPPQHLIILGRDVWERDRWRARTRTNAFICSDAQFTSAQRQFPYASPWFLPGLAEPTAVIAA